MPVGSAPAPVCAFFLLKLVGYLVHPAHPLGMIEAQHLRQGPVHVSSQKGCLLVNPVQGVARYPPSSGTSASWLRPQCGHSTVIVRGVSPFTRL